MATTIAKAVVGSKVKSVTKELEGAVGLDDNDKQRTAEAEAVAKKEAEKKQEMRKREKRELHSQKEAERQNIRSKYQLPSSSNNKRPQDNRSKETASPSENKCTVS